MSLHLLNKWKGQRGKERITGKMVKPDVEVE